MAAPGQAGTFVVMLAAMAGAPVAPGMNTVGGRSAG